MKKLIMLSIFALGTITAGASELNNIDNFLNPKSIENPFQLKRSHRVQMWRFDPNNFGLEIVCFDRTYCKTDQEMEMYWWIINEQILSSCPSSGYMMRYTVGGICF